MTMSNDGLPTADSLSPFPLEVLQQIISSFSPRELVGLLRVNSFFHSAVVGRVYERVPSVALQRRRHLQPPLKNTPYASHVRVLDVAILAKRCCQPRCLVLPNLEVLRLELSPHTQHVPLLVPWNRPHVRGSQWGAGQQRGARLPKSLCARTVVLRFSLGGGVGRRLSLKPPPERLVMFLRMPSSVFDMEPLPLLLSKELPTDTRAVVLVLECPRQPQLIVDVVLALFQLADFVASTAFSAAYRDFRRLEVVVPDYVFGHNCRGMVQREVERLMRPATDVAGAMPIVELQLASEFLNREKNRFVLTDEERDVYWMRSRPKAHRSDALDISHAVAQAKRLGELAGAVWNTLFDNYEDLWRQSSGDKEDEEGRRRLVL